MKRCITLVIFMAPIAILLGAAADPNASLRWADRLESLTPSRPIDYFELAEEIAFEADNPEDERLASTLYVLSFELDRRRAGAETLGRSVCLALAQLSKSEEERRWLLAMSKSLDRRDAPARWGGDAIEQEEDLLASALARALARYRSGAYRQAKDTLQRPQMQQYIQSLPGPDQRLMETIRLWVDREPFCPVCRNQRITRADPQSPARLCDRCGGDPGPRLDGDRLLPVISLESRLLGAEVDSWAAQLAVDRGRPLRDIDPDELRAWFRVDPARPLWRGGEWVESDPADQPTTDSEVRQSQDASVASPEPP